MIMMDKYKNIPSLDYTAMKYRGQIKSWRGQMRAIRLKIARRLRKEEVLDIVLLEKYQRINAKIKATRILYAEICFERNML